ncbi:hypothetical protein PLICRDRAFT_683300 [Plicaturopsis crispa FD-325 SS-3]|nr:hypothetical protein PLICRDRAFT_683300 [Plicaturopsis crispa FD-325 SS-3]
MYQAEPSIPAFLSSRRLGKATSIELGDAAEPTLDAWIALQLIGSNICLPVLLVTFLLSKTIKRHFTLINVCIVWIISGTLSLLLFYAGKHKGPEPPQGLCIAQSSFLAGITPMGTVSTLMLMISILASSHNDPTKAAITRLKSIIMLLAPYITFFVFWISSLVVALHNPHNVDRDRRFFYCSLHNRIFSHFSQAFTLIACLVISVIEVIVANKLYHNWQGKQKAGLSADVDVQLVLRVLAFGFYIFAAICFSLVSLFVPYSPATDMYFSTIPLVVFLIFGTQPDVLRAWAFWRPRRYEVDDTIVRSTWSPSFDMSGSDKPAPSVYDVRKLVIITHMDKEQPVQPLSSTRHVR